MTAEELRIIIEGAILLVLVAHVVLLMFREGAMAADARFTEGIEARHNDRAVVAFWEQRYKELALQQREAMDVVVNVLRVVAPLTPIKSDDALVDLLEDVQTPGEDTTEVVG